MRYRDRSDTRLFAHLSQCAKRKSGFPFPHAATCNLTSIFGAINCININLSARSTRSTIRTTQHRSRKSFRLWSSQLKVIFAAVDFPFARSSATFHVFSLFAEDSEDTRDTRSLASSANFSEQRGPGKQRLGRRGVLMSGRGRRIIL